MENKKRRILFVGEASYLATGFSTYWNEVLKRLHESGEVEIAEIGSYGKDNDPQIHNIPWKFYPVQPDPKDKEATRVFMANRTNQFGELRFDRVCLDFKPDIVCVPPGTMVETPSGQKPIETINKNDIVITHKGNAKKVLSTSKTQHVGKMVKIYPFCENKAYSFTPEHPVLAIQSKKRTWRERDVQQRHLVEDAKFIEAGKLGIGDYVLIPIYRPKKKHNGKIDITKFLDQFILDENDQKIYPVGHKNYNKDNGIPKNIDITCDLSRLLGYYCAEGSCSKGSIEFSFGTTELENKYVQDVKNLIKTIFKCKSKITKHKIHKSQQIRSCSVILNTLFGKLCGIGAHNKKVPDCIIQSNDDKVIKSFLEGLIKGDGCYKPDTVSLSTVSEIMARQVRMLFARVGVKSSIMSKTNPPNGFIKVSCLHFNVECYGQNARLAHEFIQKQSVVKSRVNIKPKWLNKGTKGWITKDYMVIPIRRIRKDNYRGQVYNLEVDKDNSYVTGFSVHNCAIRDFWMDEFILRSPFRDKFHLCLDPKTMVLTENGSKPIKDIEIGDMVLTHRGVPQTVTDTEIFKTDKSMTSIQSSLWFEPILSTIDHKFLAIKYPGRVWDKNRNLYAKNSDQWSMDDAEWIEAGKLKNQDILIIPKELVDYNDPHINLENFTKRELDYETINGETHIRAQNRSHTGHWIKNHQAIDDDLSLFFGYFLAEGTRSDSCGYFSFSFHQDETKYINDVLRIAKKKFGITGTVRKCKDSLAVNVTFCSVLLSDLFSCFYTKDKKKTVPDWLFKQENKIVANILYGWLRGDGCLTKTCHDQKMVEGFTSSYDLAIQLFRICCRLKLVTNIIKRKPSESVFKDHSSPNIGGYRLQFHGQCAKTITAKTWPNLIGENFSKISKHRTWFDKNGNLLTQIKNVKENIDHDGMVCDITVKNDHSFLTPFITHNCWMPTIDGIPQKQQWLDGYSFCDKILTYSKWGFDVLKKEGRPNTNLITVASPGADIDMFKPVEDKRAHKTKIGIDPDSIIVGTVMRNQGRKLYIDLIQDFSQWVYKAKSKGHVELAKKTFLYLHTSYPDQGWDIGDAIKRFKMGNKVLMTYLCAKCHVAFPSFFKGEITHCPSCGSMAAKPPNAGHSCSRKVLADIMNVFDLYV